ncbi:MAG: CAP domain-containing protein [Candidatus Magasanikbacteria bacterium]|nr:CAP domain-containing protein [Candidatus Magasanikbacteria bacterium]
MRKPRCLIYRWLALILAALLIVYQPVNAAVLSKRSSVSQLSATRIIAATNQQRKKTGLAALKTNVILNRVAAARLTDMFKQQYFAHRSPDNTTATDLINQFGYDYLGVAENLALGNFVSDAAVVAAWLKSPGHRKNLLEKKFADIGLAVKRGNFRGRSVWLAVQIFGRPRASCPTPDAILKNTISEHDRTLTEWQATALSWQKELDTLPTSTLAEANYYNGRVADYNGLIAKIKLRNQTLQEWVEIYNQQIDAFNICLKGELS